MKAIQSFIKSKTGILRHSKAKTGLSLALIMLGLFYCPLSYAREQWEIPRSGPAPTPPDSLYNSNYLPNAKTLGLVSPVQSNFWNNQNNLMTIPYGSVLTGVFEQDLSSAKTQPGEYFSILLADGYFQNGMMLIPPGSRIKADVLNVIPAAHKSQGAPGQLDISLRSIIFPDGRSMPIYGFIDHNVNLDAKTKGPVNGSYFSGFGAQSISSFGNSFVRGVGVINKRINRGLDFSAKAGDQVTIRINRTMTVPSAATAPGMIHNPYSQSPTIPGLADPVPQPQMQPIQNQLPIIPVQQQIQQQPQPINRRSADYF